MSKFGVSGFGPGSYVLPDGTKFTIEHNQLAKDADAARKRKLPKKKARAEAQVLPKKKARAEAREKKNKERAQVAVGECVRQIVYEAK